MAPLRKAQGSIEYLVIFAAVLVVTLIVAALLGFFPSFTGDVNASQSVSYWQSARPFSVLDSFGSGSWAQLVIQNQAPRQLVLQNVSTNGGTAAPALTLSPGQTVLVNITSGMTSCSGRAGKYNSYDLNFTYDDGAITAKKQVGAKQVAILCQ